MITIADLRDHLAQFDDNTMVALRADTERELYDDTALIDVRERLSFEPVSLMAAEDVDHWEPDNGEPNRFRMEAFAWKRN